MTKTIICVVVLTAVILAVAISRKHRKSELKAFKKFLADQYAKGEPVAIFCPIENGGIEDLNKAVAYTLDKLYDLGAKPKKITINERYRTQFTSMLTGSRKLMFWGIPCEFGKLADAEDFIVETEEVTE